MSYESEMRGEKKKSNFNNAQPDMRGEKGKKMKEPGGAEAGPKSGKMKMAAGGVAKMRHGVATASGAPKMQSKKMPRKG